MALKLRRNLSDTIKCQTGRLAHGSRILEYTVYMYIYIYHIYHLYIYICIYISYISFIYICIYNIYIYIIYIIYIYVFIIYIIYIYHIYHLYIYMCIYKIYMYIPLYVFHPYVCQFRNSGDRGRIFGVVERSPDWWGLPMCFNWWKPLIYVHINILITLLVTRLIPNITRFGSESPIKLFWTCFRTLRIQPI